MSEISGINKPLDNVHHLVKKGHLLAVSYDTEVTELSKRYATIFRAGLVIADLGGRVLEHNRFDMKLPRYTPISPTAALITDLTPEQAFSDDGDNLEIGMAKIKSVFKYSYKRLWDMAEESEDIIKDDDTVETVRLYPYPIRKSDGTVYKVRLHNGGKQVSYPINKDDGKVKKTYRCKDGTFWKLADFKPLRPGFNNIGSDDEWITSNAHRVGFVNKFITNQNRIDVMKMTQLVLAFGAYKEDGLKIGKKIDINTGAETVSMKLSAMMEANTYDANPKRGQRDGARMPDGSKYDREKAHVNPEYDAEAAFALYNFLRTREPEIVKHCEKMSDFEYAKEFLWRGMGTNQQPILAFTRYRSRHNQPLHFYGMTVNMDELYGAQKTAVILRLDTDLIHYRYQDKTLPQMNAGDWANMMWEQRNDPQALVQFEKIMKSPSIIDAETAFKNGRHKGHRPEDLHARRIWVLENKELLNTIMQAYEIIRPRFDLPETVENPRMQDEIYSDIGVPDYLFIPDNDNKQTLVVNNPHDKRAYYYNKEGRLIDFESELYTRIADTWSFDNKISRAYLRMMEPHPIMWTEESDTNFKFLRDDYIGVIKEKNRWLRKHNLPAFPAIDTRPAYDDNGRPTRYRIKDERAELEQMLKEKGVSVELSRTGNVYIDYMHDLMSLYTLSSGHYTVKDNSAYVRLFRKHDTGRVEISFERYLGYSKAERQELWRNNNFEVDFLPIASHPKHHAVLSRLYDCGRIDYFPADKAALIKNYIMADGCRNIHGDPNKDVSQHRFMTDVKAMQEIEFLQNNVKINARDKTIAVPFNDGEIGTYDFYGTKSDAVSFLERWKDFFEMRMAANPFTDKFKEMIGFDSRNNRPIVFSKYEMLRDECVVITVPEKHLMNPQSDKSVAENFFYIQKPSDDILSKFSENKKYIILRASESGKHYLAPDAFFTVCTQNGEQYAYASHLSRARDDYGQTGHDFPENDNRSILISADLLPLSGVRHIDENVPSLKLPKDIYTSVTAPALMNLREPATAFMLPDYGYDIKIGAVRFREIEESDYLPEGTETGFEVNATVTSVRNVTLGGLIKDADNGKFTDFDATRMGFTDKDSVVDRFRRYFNTFDRPITDEANSLLYISINPVDTKSGPQSYARINDRLAVIKGDPLYRL